MTKGKNFFEIETPDTYFCRVWSYFVSHSRLLIRGYKEKFHDDVFYLDFAMVQYFEGPLSWEGANFYIGNSDEYIKLLQQRGPVSVPDDYLLGQFHLHVVDLPDLAVVKIVAANNASKTTFIPPDYSWSIEPGSS